MTKQEYINYKKTNQMKVIYEYYKDKFDHKKHKPFLPEQEFYVYIQMNRDLNETYIKVANYYDSYFNVVTILDEKGNIITAF
jgi:uncharacterized protein YueI